MEERRYGWWLRTRLCRRAVLKNTRLSYIRTRQKGRLEFFLCRAVKWETVTYGEYSRQLQSYSGCLFVIFISLSCLEVMGWTSQPPNLNTRGTLLKDLTFQVPLQERIERVFVGRSGPKSLPNIVCGYTFRKP